MSGARANPNFHTVGKSSVFDARLKDPRFQEYRRRWAQFPERFTVGEFPIHLDIESTGVCNLRCPFCATTMKNWGPEVPGYLKWELFTRIIDEGAAEGLFSIKLSFRGEPTLHPKLPEMVAYAKQKGILDVYFNTNATLLTGALIHRLIDAGLDRISISFEGTSKESYEAYRVGAQFERVVANVQTLRRLRDERGLGIPQIRVQSVMLAELRERFSEYVNFWEATADEIAYLDHRREGPEDDHRGLVADWACPFLWQRMTILWDGTALPCLMHGVSDFSLLALGRAGAQSIRSMWLSEEASRYRRLHAEGQAHKLQACDRCSYRAMELEKLGAGKVHA
ncbi:MAG: radical SAM protein [Candidatus Omnitrophica bacterium]|nr:radical SAM protein [Candidatus Omnitrophota bacterium]